MESIGSLFDDIDTSEIKGTYVEPTTKQIREFFSQTQGGVNREAYVGTLTRQQIDNFLCEFYHEPPIQTSFKASSHPKPRNNLNEDELPSVKNYCHVENVFVKKI